MNTLYSGIYCTSVNVIYKYNVEKMPWDNEVLKGVNEVLLVNKEKLLFSYLLMHFLYIKGD